MPPLVSAAPALISARPPSHQRASPSPWGTATASGAGASVDAWVMVLPPVPDVIGGDGTRAGAGRPFQIGGIPAGRDRRTIGT